MIERSEDVGSVVRSEPESVVEMAKSVCGIVTHFMFALEKR